MASGIDGQIPEARAMLPDESIDNSRIAIETDAEKPSASPLALR